MDIVHDSFESTLKELFDFRLSKGDQKRIEIVQATIDCLAELGIEKTSFAAIAEKMGTRKSHVNYYYKDKDDIYYDIYKFIAGTYQEYSIAYLEQKSKSKDKLFRFLDAYFHWARENEKQLNAMFLLYYFCFHKPRFREVNQKIREGGIERLSFILREQFSLTPKKSQLLAKGIQAIMSHAAVDSYTFMKDSCDPVEREKEARKLIKHLLSSAL